MAAQVPSSFSTSFDSSASNDITTVSLQDIEVGDDIVGEGQFGICQIASATLHGVRMENLVIKYVRYSPDHSDFNCAMAQIENEIRILSRLNYSHVVKFIAEVVDPGNDYWKAFLMERMMVGSLHTFILNNLHSPLLSSPEFCGELCRELAEAVYYLHYSSRMIHGDINPNNVLLSNSDGQLVLKLSDFGTSFAIGDQPQHMTHGTDLFSAPEVHYGMDCTVKSDVFAFGMTAYFVMYQRLPLFSWDGDFDHLTTAIRRDVEVLHGRACLNVNNELEPSEPPQRPALENGDPADKAIKSAWEPNPDDRPTMEEIVQMFRP